MLISSFCTSASTLIAVPFDRSQYQSTAHLQCWCALRPASWHPTNQQHHLIKTLVYFKATVDFDALHANNVSLQRCQE